ncbi:COP9 signalosome complex subunit 5, partial [Cladochytrium tenue]
MSTATTQEAGQKEPVSSPHPRQVAAVIPQLPDGRVVLVSSRKDSRRWVLPKGGIEPGESPAVTSLADDWPEQSQRSRITVAAADVPRLLGLLDSDSALRPDGGESVGGAANQDTPQTKSRDAFLFAYATAAASVVAAAITADTSAASVTAAAARSPTDVAGRRFELENNIRQLPPQEQDRIYRFDNTEHQRILSAKPWKNDPNHFKKVKISAVALIKMVMHARSGGNIEVMGLMQGKVVDDSLIIMDSFALPVEGTETRVNAQAEAYEYMVNHILSAKDV